MSGQYHNSFDNITPEELAEYDDYLAQQEADFEAHLAEMECEEDYYDDYEDDGQPDEYTEWQDYMGGDDWDHGQYDDCPW